jgi:hypothetical protein
VKRQGTLTIYVPILRGPVAAPIGYVIGKLAIKRPVAAIDAKKQGGRTNAKSIAISHPGARDPGWGPSSRSAIAAGAARRVTAVSTVQMKIRTGNSFLGSGATMGASPVPIAGHAGPGDKNTNALAWMCEAVRIDDLSQPAPTSVGEADDGTPTPIGYTGTQFIAALEWDPMGGTRWVGPYEWDPIIEPDTAARPACSKPDSKYGPTLAEDLPIATERCCSSWS